MKKTKKIILLQLLVLKGNSNTLKPLDGSTKDDTDARRAQNTTMTNAIFNIPSILPLEQNCRTKQSVESDAMKIVSSKE